MCVILFWPSKIENSLILMQNMFKVWDLRTNWLKNLFLENLGWIQVYVFEKLLFSYSCISFMKYCALRSFYIKLFCFSKSWFFHASFMFRIHMYCIDFFCIHLVVLRSYLSLFSHITCIHFATLGTQLDQKIDWLIFELCTF